MGSRIKDALFGHKSAGVPKKGKGVKYNDNADAALKEFEGDDRAYRLNKVANDSHRAYLNDVNATTDVFRDKLLEHQAEQRKKEESNRLGGMLMRKNDEQASSGSGEEKNENK